MCHLLEERCLKNNYIQSQCKRYAANTWNLFLDNMLIVCFDHEKYTCMMSQKWLITSNHNMFCVCVCVIMSDESMKEIKEWQMKGVCTIKTAKLGFEYILAFYCARFWNNLYA